MKKSIFTLLNIIFCLTFSVSIFAQGFNSVTTPDGVNIVAVGNSGKLYRSTNGGAAYLSYTYGVSNFNSVTSFGNDVWFAGQNGNIHKTLKTNAPINTYNVGISTTLNSIIFIDANTGFACGDGGVVYKSINGGINWSSSNSGISSVKLNSISFRDVNNGTVVGNNGSVYVTSDGGSSWSMQAIGTTRNLLKVKYFNDSLVVVGEYGTLWMGTIASAPSDKGTLISNAESFTSIASSTKTDIRGVTGTSINDVHICGGGGFIRNNGNANNAFLNFEQNPMMAELVDIIYYDNNRGWAVCSSNSVIMYTTNGGSSWNMPASSTVSYSWVLKQSTTGNIGNPFCIHPQNRNGVFILAGSSLYRSLDKGNTWMLLSSGILGGSCHSFFVNALDTNIMIASKGSGATGRVIKSTNYGTNWFNVVSPITLTSYGMPLEVDPNNPNTIYLAPDGDSLMKSTDFGVSWISLGGGEPGNIFRSPCDIVIQYDNPNTIFIGDGTTNMNFGKFWKSVNGGLNWTLINTVTGSEIPMIANTSLDLNLVCHTTWSSGSYWKSTNMGSNFTNLNQSGSLWATDIAKDDPTAICYDQYGNNAFISLNSGGNFTSTNVTSSPAAGICFLDKSNLLIQHGGGVYKCVVTYTYNPPAGALFTQMNIKLAPQGLYNGLTLNLSDTITVYLRSTIIPFNKIDSAKTVIDSLSLTAECVFQNAPSGTYYIQIKHRNSIETWSRLGGESFTRGITSSYDFTSSQGQSYGNNSVLVGSVYCIYSGDVNQDGIIDVSDISNTYNDATNSVFGYTATDVNGDYFVDVSDLSIVFNNSSLTIAKNTPEVVNDIFMKQKITQKNKEFNSSRKNDYKK